MADPENPRINLVRPMALIHEVLTSALVKLVWNRLRTVERTRIWGLEQLARFWIAVSFYAPASLRQALSDGLCKPGSPYEVPSCSAPSLFARSQELSWRFMAGLFHEFRARAVQRAPEVFARDLKSLFRRFHHIVAVDGSRLNPIRRRLKILWKSRCAVIPGSLVAFYDLATGTVARLTFSAKAMASEFRNFVDALVHIKPGTLIIGDRLYGTVRFFEALCAHGLFGVARRFKPVQVHRLRRLSRKRHEGGYVEDWEVKAGSGQSAKPQKLRLILLLMPGKKAFEVFTNVLQPHKLSAEEVLSLYRRRWTIERLFSDLKEVLHLHRLYAANVNAVATQVFAAVILHTALRISQGIAARDAKIEPEEISTKKFFPMAATASANLIGWQFAYLSVAAINPGLEIKEPAWSRMAVAYTTLDEVRVEERLSPKGRSRRRPGLRAWGQWPKSLLNHPP